VAIDRSGPVPPYWMYLVEAIIIPNGAPPNQNLLTLQSAGLRWVQVPNYQRGISWQTDQVSEFLDSDSILLGNVILGQFSTPANQQQFPYLPANVTQYHVLVDGLQRLAVGTILLALLHDRFLSPSPTRPNDAPHFAGLSALVQSRAAAYLHNDTEFRQHPRKAIRDQYQALRDSLTQWIEDEIQAGKVLNLAAAVTRTMTVKQIAIDVYFNFPSHVALMNTFLGLNTVRVDLGPVDLLRSFIIEKATTDGWTAGEIEDVENQLTEVFTRDEQPDGELLPFVKIVLEMIRSTTNATKIFPSWTTSLDRAEVDRFLQFVADMKSSAGNHYFDEVRNCGSIPFAVLLAFYYRSLVSAGQGPDFLTGGTSEDANLHMVLMACYRVLLDGRIGRTRDFAADCLRDKYATLASVAEAMSTQFLKIGLGAQVDAGWLRGALLQADKNRAKRIFNAMRLPARVLGFGGPFSPLIFGRRSIDYHIDHLIPESMLIANVAGIAEANGIRNFAPLPSNQNRVAKATSCSSKLTDTGIYGAYIGGTGMVHQYSVWLVKDHAPKYSPPPLDDQKALEINASPGIGDARLEKISAELISRL
jgi:Protein of unknown function DUF262